MTGASPTTLRAKVWADGALEPAAWNTTQTNSEAALQTAGALGVRSYAGSAVTNTPITVSVDELRASVPAPDDGVAPAAPQNLAATPGSNRVALTWTPNSESDLVGYHVYRSTSTPVPTTGTPLSGSGPMTDAGVRRHDRRQRHDISLRRRRRGLDGPALRSLERRRRHAQRGRRQRPAAQRHEPVRHARRCPGAEHLNFTLELWFRRTGAGVGTSTGSGGIANAIPLISKGRSESGSEHELLPRHRRGQRRAGGRLRGRLRRLQPSGVRCDARDQQRVAPRRGRL